MSDLVALGFKVDTSQLTRGQRELEKTAISGAKTDKAVSALGSSFGALASSVAITATAMAALNKTVQVARQFDILNASLITATGSADNAAAAFVGIQKLAEQTPYDLAQVTTAFVKLKNLGLDPSREALISYGNTAAAMGKSLDQFIEAVADAATAEFERLKEFGIRAKNQGDTVAFTFRGVTKTVKNEASAIEGYLKDLGNVEFAGAMEQRMSTLDGAISNFGDAWDNMFLSVSNNGVGDAVESTVRTATHYVNEFTKLMNENGHEIQKIGIAIASGLHTSFVQLGGFMEVIGEEIKFAISNPLDFVKGKVIDLLQFLSSLGTSTLDFLGLDSSAISSVTNNLEQLRGVTVTQHNLMLQSIREATATEIAGIENIYGEMFVEVEQKAIATAQKRIELAEKSVKVMSEKVSPAIGQTAEEIKNLKKEQEEWQKISERAADRIDQAFVDVFMNIGDGFSALTDGLKNAFKQMLAEMAVQAMKANFLNPLMSGISGLFGTSGGFLGGIGASFGALGSLFSGGLAGLSLGGIGAALPAIGLIAGGTSLVNSLTGGGLFGTSYKETGRNINLGYGSGSAFGSMMTEEQKKRSLFRGTKTRKSTSDIDTSAINAAFDSIEQAIISGSEILGVNGAEAALANFTASLRADIKDKSEAEVQEIINTWISSTTNGMVDAALGRFLGDLQREGEPLVDTLQRVVVQTEVFNNVIDSLWLNFDGTAQAAALAADNLVNLVGGLDQFAALNNQLASFASWGDQWNSAYKDIYATFTELGMTIPKSREAFYDLMQGIDLSTSSGQELYATLLKLVPNLDKWYSLEDERDREWAQKQQEKQRILEQQAQAEQRLNEQRQNLTIRLLEAQGKSEEALALSRQLELAALDDSLKAIMMQIYAEQDKAKAAEEAQRKQEEIIEKQKQALDELYATLVDNVLFAESEVEKARDAELARLELVIDKAEEAYLLEVEAISVQREAYYQLIDDLTVKADQAAAMLEKSRNVELQKIAETITAAEAEYNQQMQIIAAQEQAFNELYSTLVNNVDIAKSALDAARNAEIENISQSVAAAQSKYSAEIDAINNAENAYKELLSTLESNVSSAMSMLERARGAEIGSINAQRQAFEQLTQQLQNNSSAAQSALEKSLNAELAKYDALAQAAQDSASAEIAAINSASNARLNALNAERSIVASVANQLGAAARGVSFKQALDAARRGDFEAASRITSGADYTDATSAKVGSAREAFALAEIGRLADAQLSDIDRQIAAQESSTASQIAAIESGTAAQLAQIEADKKAAEAQVKALLGIDDSVLSLDLAMAQYQKAQDELNAQIGSDTLAQLQAQEDALNAQIDALLGIDNSVLSVADAIAQLTQAQTALGGLQAGDFESLRLAAEQQLQSAIDSASTQIEALNAQIDALLGIDNSVLSVADAIAQLTQAQAALGGIQAGDFAAMQQTAQEQLQAVIDSANTQAAQLNAQIDGLLGIDNSVLGLADAIAQYNAAQSELNTALNADTLAQLQAQEDAAKALLDETIKQTQEQADLLNKQIDELLNIDNSVMALNDAITLLLNERKALADLEYGKQVEQLNAQVEQIAAQQETTLAVYNVVAALEDIPMRIGNAVADVREPIYQTPPIVIFPPAAESATAKEISSLREEMAYAQQSIAKSSATTAKILQRIEIDGLRAIP
jgi:hypothetical protein